MSRSHFVDRLLEQKMQMFELNIEYERKQEEIKATISEAARLREQVKVAEEEHRVVEELRRRLETLNSESEQRYAEAQAEDQKVREAAAAELRAEMNRINEMLASVAAEEQKVASEKQVLTKKLEILNTYKAQGSTKFDEALKERDARVKVLRESLQGQIDVRPTVVELLEKAEKKLEVSKPIFEEVRAKLTERKNHMGALRDRLDDSKRYYEEANANRDRFKKMLESIHNDVEVAVSRLEKTQADRNQQKRRVALLEEKLDTVQRQIIQITKATNTLLGIEDTTPTPEKNNTADAEETPSHADPTATPLEEETATATTS